MNISFTNATTAFLCFVTSIQLLSAQTHKSYLANSKESLPMNRAAFIFCYNNATTIQNPGLVVLEKQMVKKQAVKNTVQPSNNNTEETVCMFPNKTEDELWIEVKNRAEGNSPLRVEIYNHLGEQVYVSSIQQNLHKVNVCDFTAGTFLVKLGDTVQKLIIE